MTTQQIKEIRERCKAASPGPWSECEYGQQVYAKDPYGKGEMRVADIRGWGHLTGSGLGAVGFREETAAEIQEANKKFIAHARQDIPALLDEVERLRLQSKLLQNELGENQERLQASPFGDDKIDELEEALDNLKHQNEALIAAKDARIAELERERDAAVEDLKALWPCAFCVREEMDMFHEPCKSCCKGAGLHWEWRGPKEA